MLIKYALRDARVLWRNRSDIANPLLFFVVALSFFPLGVSPDAKVLGPIASGLVWVVALLSTQISLDSLFKADYDDGCLEQMLYAPVPLSLVIFIRVIVYWLFMGLPLCLISPVLALMLSMPTELIPILVLTLFLGTIFLCFVGAIGAALTVSLRRGGVLVSLISMPLCVPPLIFGANAVHQASQGMDVTGVVLILFALSLLALIFAPLVIASALRMSLENG